MAYISGESLLSDVKQLLGISDETQDALLTLILTQTGTKVLNEINQATMPAALEPIIAEMAADAYRLNQSEAVGLISSASDHSQSVSYDQTATKAVSAVLKNYSGQLDRFRCPGW